MDYPSIWNCVWACLIFVIGKNYQLVYLINVTRLPKRNSIPLLLVKEKKHQVLNNKSFLFAYLFPWPDITLLDTIPTLILIVNQAQYETKHTTFLVSQKQLVSYLYVLSIILVQLRPLSYTSFYNFNKYFITHSSWNGKVMDSMVLLQIGF